MRYALLTFLLVLVGASPAGAQVTPDELQAVLPSGLHRQEDGSLALGGAYLSAGDFDGPASFSAVLSQADGVIGGPYRASWHLSIDREWCPARDTVVTVVLTSPYGHVWSGSSILVPARGLYEREPDRVFGFSDDPDLRNAIDGGGRFLIGLDDDQGRRLREVAIIIPGPEDRRRMHEANKELLRTADPASVAPRPRQPDLGRRAPGGRPLRRPPPRVPRDCVPN